MIFFKGFPNGLYTVCWMNRLIRKISLKMLILHLKNQNSNFTSLSFTMQCSILPIKSNTLSESYLDLFNPRFAGVVWWSFMSRSSSISFNALARGICVSVCLSNKGDFEQRIAPLPDYIWQHLYPSDNILAHFLVQ